MRVLVTGASGFIGSRLVGRLRANKRVKVGILNRTRFPLDKPDKLIKALQEVDVVIHLAGKNRGEPLDLVHGNLVYTVGLLDAISRLEGPKPKFIFASTFAVYAAQNKFLDENTDTVPRNMYGWSKLWAEQATGYYSRACPFPALILRFTNVYGPGMPPFAHSVVSTFLELARKGQVLKVNGDGDQVRDFVFVDDVVSAIVKALGWKPAGDPFEVVNISSGEGISINELIEKIGRVVGREPNVSYNHEVVEHGCWVGGNLRAEKLLGWKPQTRLEKGLAETLISLG